jgi:hypothetical protein
MTNVVPRSMYSGCIAVLFLVAVGFCPTAQAAPTAYLKINGVDIALKTVNSGNPSILQWKNDPSNPITNKTAGLGNIAWSTDGCIRLSLHKGLKNNILNMASG